MTSAFTVPHFWDGAEMLTADDFLVMDVDTKVHLELIDGQLIITPSPLVWHNKVRAELRNMIGSQVEGTHETFTDLDVCLDDRRVLRPDVLVATRDAFLEDRAHRLADVLLAIEVVSPGTAFNDRMIKPVVYREAGLEYWRIEREGDDLVLHQEDGTVSRGSFEAELLDGRLPIRLDLVELATCLR